MSASLQEITQWLAPQGAVLHGDAQRRISRLASLASASTDCIGFFTGGVPVAQLQATQAGCVLVSPAWESVARQRGDCIVLPNPHAGFARLTQWWKKQHAPAVEYRIHPSATVHPQAHVGEGAIIGPLCVVERGARIGAGTWLKSRVTISEDCTVGERCIIHPGAVIGADGFGFANDQGKWIKIEQLGAVRIGNDVEIGANTCVDRGALDDTVIEDGVKLDNLIQIAHNVHLGRNVAIAANAGIAGSTTVEEGVTIGGAANIMGHITLGKGVHISATSFASRSLTKPGQYTGFFPIDDNAAWEKNAATVKQLHQLRTRIKNLEEQLKK